ncbi:MAG: head GIN domain-containing protein [Archangium sp.]|nr:head GIN domain-containing protein [Archangium sp.]MDP3571001.1 head GIN domain-containing protein [Archangium sp.]
MRALPLLGLLAVSSTPSLAATVTENRKISDFQVIEASGGVILEVKRGPTSLTIEGDAEAVKLYGTEVVGNVLKLKSKTKSWNQSRGEILVKVTTPSLSRLEASGGVRASLTDVAAPKFSAELSGGVQLEAPQLAVDTLELEASGGVTMNLSGKARDAKLNLSGGVELKGKGLEIAKVKVDASGGCNADLTVKESVIGDISGGVGLTVRGNPPKSQVHTGGGADVHYVD